MARSNIRKSAGAKSGGRTALAGLILGYVGLVWAVALAGLALPAINRVRMQAKEAQTLSNARQIAIGCIAYANDHHDAFPPKLDDLLQRYVPNRNILTSPLSPGEPIAFDYFGGTSHDPPEKLLLISKYKGPNNQRAAAHVDGSVAMQTIPGDRK